MCWDCCLYSYNVVLSFYAWLHLAFSFAAVCTGHRVKKYLLFNSSGRFEAHCATSKNTQCIVSLLLLRQDILFPKNLKKKEINQNLLI